MYFDMYLVLAHSHYLYVCVLLALTVPIYYAPAP